MATGSPWPAACRPRPTGARGRGRTRWRSRGRGCRAGPTRCRRCRPCAACCRGCCRRRGGRAPARVPNGHVVAQDGERRRRTSRACRACAPTCEQLPSGIGLPSRSSNVRASARRKSSRAIIPSVIPSSSGVTPKRISHSSGGGTSGICSHMPAAGLSRWPSAALTVRISRSPTWPTARAWVTLRPSLATMTSMSMIEPVSAYERYCAVAQTTGRPVVRSMASMPAPRPQPPQRKLPRVDTPGVTGMYQRVGLWVGCRPRNVLASTGREHREHRSPGSPPAIHVPSGT